MNSDNLPAAIDSIPQGGGGLGYTEYTASGLESATIAAFQPYWTPPVQGESSWQVIQIVPLEDGYTGYYNAITLLRIHSEYSLFVADKIVGMIRASVNNGSATKYELDSTATVTVPNGFKILVYDKVVIHS